ncbi:MAG: DUF2252 domain-containing protein [Acidobacteriia bacterium]|nr:DUF2252 domain-containing protein [Terriglobia bacterium]
MDIVKATQQYEAWLGERIPLLRRDLDRKHAAMAESPFPFLRATFYRWAQIWPDMQGSAAEAPEVLGVGDLHVENFGTWRDIEGRLIWGVNDFDEACRLPYTCDLVRLATSVHLAVAAETLSVPTGKACNAILDGYRQGLRAGGRPFVLAEHHTSLREMAVERLKQPELFWQKLNALPAWKGKIPASAEKALRRALPDRRMTYRIAHRVSGLGSLGRRRFVALADWHGGTVAREAKEMAESAWLWAQPQRKRSRIYYQDLLEQIPRCPDPFVALRGRWIVRRLAPDCSRIELASLPRRHDAVRLLHAMGWETANVHLGSRAARFIEADLKKRPAGWLHKAAQAMAESVEDDWNAWRKAQ